MKYMKWIGLVLMLTSLLTACNSRSSSVLSDLDGQYSDPNHANQLMAAMADANQFDKARLHQYARDCFNSEIMARRYLDYYERVLNGETCNKQQPQLQPAYTQRYLEWQK